MIASQIHPAAVILAVACVLLIVYGRILFRRLALFTGYFLCGFVIFIGAGLITTVPLEKGYPLLAKVIAVLLFVVLCLVIPALLSMRPRQEIVAGGGSGPSGDGLAYRDFARIGLGKVPDAKTLARIGQALGPEVIAELHQRLVEIAKEKGVIAGRKMRVDTTVVETNIHYPTDSTLLGDGARVLTRTMKRIERQAGQLKRKVRDRTRSVNKRVFAIAISGRYKGPEAEERRKKQYRVLLRLSRQILNDAKRLMTEVEEMPQRKQRPLQRRRVMLQHKHILKHDQ